tara:strand:- start:42 stop:878 length:837 start_codon:yes stop_codon:yes gene_type:complete
MIALKTNDTLPSSRFPKVGRGHATEDTVVTIGKAKFGATYKSLIAGPCAVESYEQLSRVAVAVKALGVKVLRGGAFKPRTSPYSFQGLGVEGLQIMRRVCQEQGLAMVTEAVDLESLESVCSYADAIQIGARNMQNFSLLKAAGQSSLPVLLKRGPSAKIEELLFAAEYILDQGNGQVLLCERGLRGFDPMTRNLLDLSAVPLVRRLSHLPIIVDPSHAAGRPDIIGDLTMGAFAVGAHGAIIEVHDRPGEALSDGDQAMIPDDFAELTLRLKTHGFL